jgi:hypothetical protein
MKEIRDCNGHLTCMGDEDTGQIQFRYKEFEADFTLDVGKTLHVKRKGTSTQIYRTPSRKFKIVSTKKE